VHFAKCLRVWKATLSSRNRDEMDGQLIEATYWRMIGQDMTAREMSDLTEMVLEHCEWFPTIAECKKIMAGGGYSNRFYVGRRVDHLKREGYILPGPATKEIDHE